MQKELVEGKIEWIYQINSSAGGEFLWIIYSFFATLTTSASSLNLGGSKNYWLSLHAKGIVAVVCV
jgi:hypothetical protein